MDIKSNIYQQDFTYVVDKISMHPIFYKSDSLAEFDNLCSTYFHSIKDVNTLIEALTTITMYFKDGHTNIEIPYTKEAKCLNILSFWEDNKLYMEEDNELFQIVAIEDTKVDSIVDKMSSRIPHENIYLVRSRMVEYPYQNYHLFSEINLVRLFGNRNRYKFTLLYKGSIIEKDYYLGNYNGYLDFRDDENFISFYIEGTTAYLNLHECKYNDKYINVLKQLAELCQQKQIETLVLDLSKNMGGSSSVIDEFIKYVNIDSYYRYEMIDYSMIPPITISSRYNEIKKPIKEPYFPSNIICKVSHTTFSSARTFAVTLKDNNIAKIVGEPAGGKPSSYGMPKRYITPNCHISFRISRCSFKRPNINKDSIDALYPD